MTSGFGLVLIPVYSRYLSTYDFGVLSLLTVTLTLVSIVFKFGLNHAFFRHYYETEDAVHRRRIVGSTLAFLLVSACVATLLLYWAAPQLSSLVFTSEQTRTGKIGLTDATRVELLRLVIYINFFEVVTVIPDSILRAKFRSARYSALNIAAFLFQLLFITYLVIYVHATVNSVLIGRLAGAAFEALIFYWAVRHELSMSFSLSELRGMLAFGAPLIFGQISFTLFMMIDRFFLERFATKGEVGVYSMSNSLVSVVPLLVTVPFSQVWTVMRFSVMKEEGAEEYYARVLTYITFVGMFLALGAAAVAGDGLQLYALKGYWSAGQIIPLLALAAVFDSASRVLNVGTTLKKRTIFAPLVIAAALLVNIGLNFLLIPRYESAGATVSTLISYLVFCGLRYWSSNLFFKVRYEWRRVFMVTMVGAVMIGAFYLIDALRGDLTPAAPGALSRNAKLWLSIVVKVALALLFPLLLLALGFYEERERRRLREIWRKGLGLVKGQRWRESLPTLALFISAAGAATTFAGHWFW